MGGRTAHSALGLFNEEQMPPLRRIVRFCHSQGVRVGIQLAHAGRKAFGDTRGEEGMISASPMPYAEGWRPPQQAGEEQLRRVIGGFAAATMMAKNIGFDVVEVHAAHGYLLHQFLSPLTNLRDDRYGGDIAGRSRLLLEVVERVRECWPGERPLFVRLPAGDGQDGGLSLPEVAQVARECARTGADLIDISGGTPLFDAPRADVPEVQALAGLLAESPAVPAAVGGGVITGSDAEQLVQRTGAALVSVGRPLLSDAYWPRRAAEELGVRIEVGDGSSG